MTDSMGNRPEAIAPKTLGQIRTVRVLLGLCAVVWIAALGAAFAGYLIPPGATDDEVIRLRLALVSGMGLSIAGAGMLRPDARQSWAVAVIAASAQLVTCALIPFSVYMIYLLFQPQVMRACVSRIYGTKS